MKAVSVQVPASAANLGPGFDCLALALSLQNSFVIELADHGIEIVNHGLKADELPRDETNLLVIAFYHLADRVGLARPGLRIRSANRVPPSSGLGSSTTAVLAGLLAAGELLEVELTNEETLALAAELEGHADNAAAALFGGLVAVGQTNGSWHHRQLPLAPMQLVVVVPQLSISTQQMRAALPEAIAVDQVVSNAAGLIFTVEALSRGDFDQLRWATQPSFHQRARLPHIPGGQQAMAAAAALDAAVVMAGAGPSLIALAADNHAAIGQAMQAAFAAAGVDSSLHILSSQMQGASLNPQLPS